jgi:hypothetical protein
MMGRSIALAAVAAIGLSGCAPEGPQAAATPMTPCQTAASILGNPYATPGAAEMALEFTRVKCLGMTADGSRQLRPAHAAASSSSASTNWASDEDMFKADMRAVQ